MPLTYLRLRGHRVRADGIRSLLPVLITKPRRYGPVLHEQKLSVRRDVLITGAHQSGKSRWLQRLHENAPGVWRQRPTLLIRCVEPISRWVEQDVIVEHAEQSLGRRWTKCRTWERVDAAISWAREHGVVLLMDDAHILSGRKLDIAMRLLDAAKLAVVTATDEGRLPISLRMALDRRRPQRINLRSEAAYDITPYVVWFIMILAIAAGAWEIAACAAGLNLLGRGRGAARQV